MFHTCPLPPTYDSDVHDAGQVQQYLIDLGHPVVSVTVTGSTVLVELPDVEVTPLTINGLILDGMTASMMETEGEQVADTLDIDLADFSPPLSPTQLLEQELDAIDVTTADLDQLRVAVGLLRNLLKGPTA